ncbi:ComF family protein [Echinimonas agarilytica]|uniref:ComF family protein n=1 Tax=Echinimonas agarilytica TaxID=1215918 RepID=A0AA42B968_9GAMM|nr:ComF family protein [Echinimonas agarilytica]MCM2680906.1 ComF family protein [Echinimonas agarilytica]
MDAKSRLSKLLYSAVRPQCCLCQMQAQTSQWPICQTCYAQLPLFETGCSCCAMPLSDHDLVCGYCQATPSPIAQTKALGFYTHSMRDLVTRFKYHSDWVAGKALTQSWIHRCTVNDKPDCLVPVPMHRTKLAKRGFNQATVIAHELGRALGIPVDTHTCTRVQAGQSLTGQTRKERSLQIQDCYQIRQSEHQHIVLVDDVVTSQATSFTLANQFIKLGATRVDMWCLARTP